MNITTKEVTVHEHGNLVYTIDRTVFRNGHFDILIWRKSDPLQAFYSAPSPTMTATDAWEYADELVGTYASLFENAIAKRAAQLREDWDALTAL